MTLNLDFFPLNSSSPAVVRSALTPERMVCKLGNNIGSRVFIQHMPIYIEEKILPQRTPSLMLMQTYLNNQKTHYLL